MGDLRKFDLQKIAYFLSARFFVETGTFEGDTIEYAYQRLEKNSYTNNSLVKYWTIEYDTAYAAKAVEKFKDLPRIEVLHEDSITGLEYVDSRCNGNTIFWLDAHFVGSDGGHNPYNSDEDLKSRLPLEWELRILEQRILSYRDVIIIDDVRIYEDGPFERGTFDDAMEQQGSTVKRTDISPYNSIDPLLEPFAKSHLIYKLYDHQGYVILLPKAGFSSINEILFK